MRSTTSKAALIKGLAPLVLLLAGADAYGQATINLTAGPAQVTLPDGSSVPMWGYSCGTASGGTCAALNPAATAGMWSPVVITVPTGQALTINLTNSTTLVNNVPTPQASSSSLYGSLSAIYQDECMAFIGSVTQSGVRNGDVTPGVSVLFSVVFKNLGEVGGTIATTSGNILP